MDRMMEALTSVVVHNHCTSNGTYKYQIEAATSVVMHTNGEDEYEMEAATSVAAHMATQ